MRFSNLKKTDPELYELVTAEIERQKNTLDLIPSENIASLAILEVLGTPLVNKYSEGYPGKRYYPGNLNYDAIDKLAASRALAVFGLNPEHWQVNIQALSGAPANFAVYAALVEPGGKLMGMTLDSGGHLSHGHKVSLTGKLWQSVQYGVNPETGLIDYDAVEELAVKEKPQLIISGFTAYPRRVDFKRFGEIAQKVGAYHLADISHIAGLVAAGWHLTPFPYADVVMTTTHKTLRGPRGAVIFAKKELAERVDRTVFPGLQGGPHNNVHAAIALMFQEASKRGFKNYQRQIIKNAHFLAEALKEFGLKLITDGTDTHLMLIDVRNFNLDGAAAEKFLEEVGIIANRNAVPGDDKPFNPSGLRMGTPSVTSRGMQEEEMKEIAELVHQTLTKRAELAEIKERVLNLCQRFPLPY